MKRLYAVLQDSQGWEELFAEELAKENNNLILCKFTLDKI